MLSETVRPTEMANSANRPVMTRRNGRCLFPGGLSKVISIASILCALSTLSHWYRAIKFSLGLYNLFVIWAGILFQKLLVLPIYMGTVSSEFQIAYTPHPVGFSQPRPTLRGLKTLPVGNNALSALIVSLSKSSASRIACWNTSDQFCILISFPSSATRPPCYNLPEAEPLNNGEWLVRGSQMFIAPGSLVYLLPIL